MGALLPSELGQEKFSSPWLLTQRPQKCGVEKWGAPRVRSKALRLHALKKNNVDEKKGGELETIAEMVLARHAASLARRMRGNIVAKIHSEVRPEQCFREYGVAREGLLPPSFRWVLK